MTGASQVVPLYMQMRVLGLQLSLPHRIWPPVFLLEWRHRQFLSSISSFIPGEADSEVFVHESPVSVLFCPTGLILVPGWLHCPGHSAESQCRHLRCQFHRLSLLHRLRCWLPSHVRGFLSNFFSSGRGRLCLSPVVTRFTSGGFAGRWIDTAFVMAFGFFTSTLQSLASLMTAHISTC